MSGNRGHEMLEEPFEMSGFETGYEKGKEDMRAELVKEAKGIKKELTGYDSHFDDDEVVDRRNRERGFNKGIDQIINIINNK